MPTHLAIFPPKATPVLTDLVYIGDSADSFRENKATLQSCLLPTLLKANNLSDLNNISTARTNLGAAASGANSDITALSALSGAIGTPTTITMAAGGVITANSSIGNSLKIAARDVDGAISQTFFTVTSANTPTGDLDTAVTINSQYIYRVGGTDVAIADGGTGASSAGAALSNLGAAASGANTDIASLLGITGNIDLNKTPGTDLTGSGLISTFTAGQNVTFGQPTYVDSAGKQSKADTEFGGPLCTHIALGSYSTDGTGLFMQYGYLRNDAWAWTIGGYIYLSITSTLTQSVPAGAADVRQVLGIAISATVIFICPCPITFTPLGYALSQTISASSARSSLSAAASGANGDITSFTSLTGDITKPTSLTMATGGSIRTDVNNGNTILEQVYDVDGSAYKTFGTGTVGNTPSYAWSQPSGGTLTWDGGAIGSITQANAQFYSPINAQTGTTYTLAISDCGKIITFNNASAITVTLPQQSTTATSAGFICWFINLGAGTITFVKEGSETLNGNNTAVTNASGKIMRNTTTNWEIFGGNAILNMPGIHEDIGAITTSNTIVLMGYVGNSNTLLGVYQKCRALTTAGTFAIKKNGTALSGLGAIVPSTAGSYTTATGTSSDNVLVRGDQITIVADGTLVGVLDLGLSLDITMQF